MKYLILLITFLIFDCGSTMMRSQNKSNSFIVVSLKLQKEEVLFNDLFTPYFDEVYISSNGTEIKNFTRSENYFIFDGTPNADNFVTRSIFVLRKGADASLIGTSSKILNEVEAIFNEELQIASSKISQANDIVFLGDFTVKVKFHIMKDPEIEIIPNPSQKEAEIRALQYIAKNWKRDTLGNIADKKLLLFKDFL
jgi:hypothetical protein